MTAHQVAVETQLMDLPAGALILVMGQVPISERLGVCARVCQKFKVAAMTATTTICRTVSLSEQQVDGLIRWLDQHGSHVTGITIYSGANFSLAELPCPQLRHLELFMVDLHFLDPREHGARSICYTGLTRLVLAGCSLEGRRHQLAHLSCFTQLQHLRMIVIPRQGSSARERATVALPSDLLSQLVQLTHLHMSCYQLHSEAALQHLSSGSALQQLELDLDSMKPPKGAAVATVLAGLEHLPQLTSLKLAGTKWSFSLKTVPYLSKLTALRTLHMRYALSVDPAMLAGFSLLQELDLKRPNSWNERGTAALLAAIGQQTQLTKLNIECDDLWHTPSAAAYSALTASSHLQHLRLSQAQFPAGAWQQMFQPTRCCPELRLLQVRHEDDGGDWGGPAEHLSEADLQAMVSCCPGLHALLLDDEWSFTAVAPLQQLTALTSLQISTSLRDNASSIVLLTQLQQLDDILRGQTLTAPELLQLTALQQLQRLFVYCDELHPALRPVLPRGEVFIRNQAPTGAPPDVWMQLTEVCEKAGAAADRTAEADAAGEISFVTRLLKSLVGLQPIHH